MIRMTQSLSTFLLKFYRDKYTLIQFGHLEEFSNEMRKEYFEWLHTEEGRSYLKGGSNYKEELER